MPVSSILVAVLAVALVAAITALVVQTRRLQAASRRVEELERLPPEAAVGSSRSPRAVQAAGQAAGLAMRTVVETASRVRTQGVRGMLLSSIDDLTAWALEDRTEIVRVAGSDGTVTILFSDIENSTALNSELGDETWMRVLAAHDRLLHDFIDKHRGHVVKNQGDGYMVVFSTPELAIGAALDIQRALRSTRQRSRQLRRTPVRVRIGLHTGTAIERDGDYFGRNVAMAARVAAMADGGEVMVSDEVAHRVTAAGTCPAGHTLVPTPAVELRGLPGEHVLWLVEPA